MFLAAFALVVAACKDDGGGGGSTDTAQPSDTGEPTQGGGEGQTLNILFSAPITGDNATYGLPMVDGAELAVRYINENGGIASGPMRGAELALKTYDDDVTTEAATSVASRYVSEQDVWALAGFITSGQAQAAGTVAAEADLIVWATYASADFLTDEPPHNIVVVGPRLDNVARAAVDFAVNNYGATKIGVIADNYSYMDSYYTGLDDYTAKLGVEWTKEVIDSGNTVDYSSYLSNLTAQGVDFILNGLLEFESGPMVTQARDLGIELPIVDLTGAGWGEAYLGAAGDAAIGTVAYDAAPLQPAPGSFAEQVFQMFEDEYGEPMRIPSMYAFDTILMIADAIAAGATDRVDVKNYLMDIDGDGTLGPLKLAEDLRSEQKVVTFSEITGTTLDAREVVTCYLLSADLTARQQDC